MRQPADGLKRVAQRAKSRGMRDLGENSPLPTKGFGQPWEQVSSISSVQGEAPATYTQLYSPSKAATIKINKQNREKEAK